ncbi:Signal transduction histidine kinase [Saccharopolyspora kobensis]|uniref:histidine kinase n=3 Tax=Saccharopolyspora kobensis TaxID=146035 RepID=A0A1H6ELN2_9PSEU|nr:Signal transduction histidine kinase [Saccharopolyspora kobensis]SFF29044.1 Signal transduction histidine kinase [Saccharopolyspora kobensis]
MCASGPTPREAGSARIHRMRALRSWSADAALAVAITLVGLVGTTIADRWSDTAIRPLDALGLAVVAAAGLSLVLRRRQPVFTAGAVALLTSTYLVLGYTYGPIMLSLVVAVYSLARHRPPSTSAPVAVGVLAVLLVHVLTTGSGLPSLLGAIPGSAWVAVPFAIGSVLRVQREAAERNRAEQLRQRVDDERLRIAQEVHDVVGHGLAAIKMQADVALHVLAKKPEQAEVALEAISRTSSDALDELRATLAVVRRSDVRTPGLARLDDLLQRMREAGLAVELSTAGQPRQLPPVVDLTGYRILQESLTNVLRHTSDKRAEVSVEYAEDAVVLTITNPLSGPGGGGGGLGLPGMRQRVASLGGEFTAGPTADRRFTVHARLPTGGTG